MKRNATYLFLIMVVSSCGPDKERDRELIYKESSSILIAASLDIMMKGYSLNVDSLLGEYTRLSASNPEFGLEYANRLRCYNESLYYTTGKQVIYTGSY